MQIRGRRAIVNVQPLTRHQSYIQKFFALKGDRLTEPRCTKGLQRFKG